MLVYDDREDQELNNTHDSNYDYGYDYGYEEGYEDEFHTYVIHEEYYSDYDEDSLNNNIDQRDS